MENTNMNVYRFNQTRRDTVPASGVEEFSRPPTPIVMSPAADVPALRGDSRFNISATVLLYWVRSQVLYHVQPHSGCTYFLRDGVASKMTAPEEFSSVTE